MHLRTLASCIALSALAACATTPRDPLLAGDYPALTAHDAVVGDHTGANVRWGGRIIRTEPRNDRTCFEIVSTGLDAEGRPRWTGEDTWGRFIACRTGFYDPAVFEPGRDVTFIGHVAGYQSTKIGDYDYPLPKIAADVVYLWPVQREVEVVPAYPYGPWGPGPHWGWGWGYRGWW